jgi:hypothetical protein
MGLFAATKSGTQVFLTYLALEIPFELFNGMEETMM